MTKKEEDKKKNEEKTLPDEKDESEIPLKTEKVDVLENSTDTETKPISEITTPPAPITTEEVSPLENSTDSVTNITPSEAINADAVEETPGVSSAQGETLPIDQVGVEKPTQETYPLADEIEKDAMRKKSFFSSLLIFRNKKGKIVLLILVVLLVVGLGVGTVLNTNNEKLSFMKTRAKTRETVTLSPTQVPSPTPMPAEIDKASLKIEVQNGNGESGVASKMKDLLIEKGYSGTIDTGNADNYDYLETVVKVKKTKALAEKELRAGIAQNYTLSEKLEELEENSAYDAIIIIGAE